MGKVPCHQNVGGHAAPAYTPTTPAALAPSSDFNVVSDPGSGHRWQPHDSRNVRRYGTSTPVVLTLPLMDPDGVAAACDAAGASLVARPFQLSYSLLLRLQMQHPRVCGIAVRDCARLVQVR